VVTTKETGWGIKRIQRGRPSATISKLGKKKKLTTVKPREKVPVRGKKKDSGWLVGGGKRERGCHQTAKFRREASAGKKRQTIVLDKRQKRDGAGGKVGGGTNLYRNGMAQVCVHGKKGGGSGRPKNGVKGRGKGGGKYKKCNR